MARPESELTKKWQNSTQPLVSVVCITYNHERFIRDAIESFLAQETDFAFSIVIAEDCSSDNTLAIVDEYCRLYPRVIKLIKNEKNLGVIENFFRTIDSVTTKYAAVCEGDDYWTNPHKLQTQIDFLQENPEYSMVCHPVTILNETQNCAAVKKAYEKFVSGHFTTRDILRGHFIPTPSLTFKTDAFHLYDWMLACRSGDIALEIILSLSGPGYFMPEPMAVYRQHDDGITKKGRLPPAEMLEKSLFLFRAFDMLTKGIYTYGVNRRLAKIHFIYAVGRLKKFEICLFMFHCWSAMKYAVKGIMCRSKADVRL
ncbi:MAG: putative glycosyltransferase [Candidatus Rifleibacterium amylolyticum]|nr:MAG: putative glycosyltransferase [Candidatus Rifleibacterium amylolyticum]